MMNELSYCQGILSNLQNIAHWEGVGALLSWDQETYMPKGAIGARSEQLAKVALLTHSEYCKTEFKGKLEALINLETGVALDSSISARERAVLRGVYRDWRLANALPSDFVEAYAKAKSRSQHAWQDARNRNDFDYFLPHLEEVIDLTRKKAHFMCPGGDVYSTLLDEYEPELTGDELDPIFERLKSKTLELMEAIRRSPGYSSPPLPQKKWNIDTQLKFSRMVLGDMGFSFDNGRLDMSTHPFSTQIHPTDVRITTRFSEEDILDGLSSTIHECGHALYEQGLNPDYFGTALCRAVSFGIHESQSRLWENGVGKSNEFWMHYLPKLKTFFPGVIDEMSVSAFYRTINRVSPSLIRVESDELTYNLHILIRYELERDLFSGRLLPKDLPSAWNDRYQSYLGLTPGSNAVGVLQDVHWSCGYFGYFPTYTVGNLYAAMLLDKMDADIRLPHLIEVGNLHPIREWLKANVHALGSEKTAKELIKHITGKTLSEESFVARAQVKFGAIYEL